jgi:hypothetical protein
MTLPRAWRRIRRVKHGFACALTLHFTISRCPALTGIAYHPWRRSIIARRRELGEPRLRFPSRTSRSRFLPANRRSPEETTAAEAGDLSPRRLNPGPPTLRCMASNAVHAEQ